MKKMIFAVIILLASSCLAQASLPEQGRINDVTNVEVSDIKHTVVSGDTLSGLICRYGLGKPSLKKYRKIAKYRNNQIKHKEFWLFVGQVIYLPGNGIVVEQTAVAVNPTTVGNESALQIALQNLEIPLKNRGLEKGDYTLPSLEKVFERISNDNKIPGQKKIDRIFKLNGKTALVATYGDGRVEYNVKITAKEELSGRGGKVIISAKEALVFVIADQCQNVYVFLEKLPSIFLPPPPPMPRKRVVPPHKLRYKGLTNKGEKVVFDASAGSFDQKYDHGTKDRAVWTHSALRYETGLDANGRKYGWGPYLNTNNWQGDWQDAEGLAPDFSFDGNRWEAGAEYWIYNPDQKQFKFTFGYIEQSEKGASEDFWGRYEKESEFSGLNFGIRFDDMSRSGKRFFSEYSVEVGYTHELEKSVKADYTDRFGKVNPEDADDTIQGISLNTNIDIFSDVNDIVTFSFEAWGNLKENGDQILRLTPWIGFFNNSIKIGYSFTEADYADSGKDFGFGLASQIHLYDLWNYFIYNPFGKTIKSVFAKKEDVDVFNSSLEDLLNQKSKSSKSSVKKVKIKIYKPEEGK